jgi:hypothetical protein
MDFLMLGEIKELPFYSQEIENGLENSYFGFEFLDCFTEFPSSILPVLPLPNSIDV